MTRATPRNDVPDAVSPPPGHPRFPAVDGLRAIAALSVVVFHADQISHASGVVARAVSHCDVGVAVFFAITGFLLYRPYVAAAVGDAPGTPWRVFYWRRFLRIAPGYWVALLVLSPILQFARPAGLGNILLVQIYRPAWVRSGIPPAWSVCVEVSFYLLLPVFADLLARWWSGRDRENRAQLELGLLAGLAVASLVLRAVVHSVVHNPYMVDPLPTTLAWFCGGMMLAVISVEPGRWGGRLRDLAGRHPGGLWTVAFVIYVATLPADGSIDTETILVFIAYGMIAVLVLAPLVLQPAGDFAGSRLLLSRPIAWLGLVSYGIYLYHYPLMREIHPGGASTVRLVVLAAFGIMAAGTAGAISYYAVERRALRLKRLPASSRLGRLLGVGSPHGA